MMLLVFLISAKLSLNLSWSSLDPNSTVSLHVRNVLQQNWAAACSFIPLFAFSPHTRLSSLFLKIHSKCLLIH